MSKSAELIKLFDQINIRTYVSHINKLIYVFESLKIEYVLIGPMAYYQYAHPRATADLDFLILESSLQNSEKFQNRIQHLFYGYVVDKDDNGKIQIRIKASKKNYNNDILITVGYASQYTIFMRYKTKNIFGITMPVANPIDLAMLFLNAVDSNAQSLVDLLTFLKEKFVSISEIESEIDSIENPEVKQKLTALLLTIIKNNLLTKQKNANWSDFQKNRLRHNVSYLS